MTVADEPAKPAGGQLARRAVVESRLQRREVLKSLAAGTAAAMRSMLLGLSPVDPVAFLSETLRYRMCVSNMLSGACIIPNHHFIQQLLSINPNY